MRPYLERGEIAKGLLVGLPILLPDSIVINTDSASQKSFINWVGDLIKNKRPAVVTGVIAAGAAVVLFEAWKFVKGCVLFAIAAFIAYQIFKWMKETEPKSSASTQTIHISRPSFFDIPPFWSHVMSNFWSDVWSNAEQGPSTTKSSSDKIHDAVPSATKAVKLACLAAAIKDFFDYKSDSNNGGKTSGGSTSF